MNFIIATTQQSYCLLPRRPMYLQHCLLRGWHHMKLLLSQKMFCVHHTTMHQITMYTFSKQLHVITTLYSHFICSLHWLGIIHSTHKLPGHVNVCSACVKNLDYWTWVSLVTFCSVKSSSQRAGELLLSHLTWSKWQPVKLVPVFVTTH